MADEEDVHLRIGAVVGNDVVAHYYALTTRPFSPFHKQLQFSRYYYVFAGEQFLFLIGS